MAASKNILNSGLDGNLNMKEFDAPQPTTSGDYFFEESNFHMLSDLSVFLLNSTIFIIQSVHLSMYASDIMCGRTSKMAFFALPTTFIGSIISYGLLFFCFSCWSDFIFYWNRVSFFLGIFNITVIELFNRCAFSR